MANYEYKRLKKETALLASLLPVTFPTAMYSVAELFNDSAAYSANEQVCLWLSAGFSTSLLLLTIANVCRLTARELFGARPTPPIPKFKNC